MPCRTDKKKEEDEKKKKKKLDGKSFKFLTNSIEWSETGCKAGKEHYVTGFISTDELDRAKEIVTEEAMLDMVAQVKSGNVKLDVEHSTFVGEPDIPIGKIIDAQLVKSEGKTKIWIKAVLNKAHSKFNEVWKSIKDGFLDAFSIAYDTKEFAKDIVDGITVTLLKSLDILNVAITGNPINTGATMTSSFMKSMEGNNMEEDKKDEEAEDDAEEKKEEEVEDSKEDKKEEEDKDSEEKKDEEEEKKDEEAEDDAEEKKDEEKKDDKSEQN